MVVDEEDKKLNNIYRTPKLHKHSSKARFIVAAPQRSAKPLTEAVISVIKVFQHRLFVSKSSETSTMYFELNPIYHGGGWGGGGGKKILPPTISSLVASTNVGISPKNFLTFSFNPFATLV